MTAIAISLTRVFRFGGRDLDDPSPDMTPDEVKRHYIRLFPRMAGAKVIEPVLEGDKQVYLIKEQGYGDKG